MDWNLLAKYLDELGTPAEVDAVSRWAAADAANAAELELMRRAWRRAGELPSAPSVEALWERIAQSAGIASHAERGATETSPRADFREPQPRALTSQHRPLRLDARMMSRRRAWPAVLVAVAAVILAWTGLSLHEAREREAARSRQAVVDVPMQEYRTARGQRATVNLLDGTRVVLGVESRLRVSVSARARVAYIEGEALFDVTHIDSVPFLVHAGGAVAQDIGTTFGIRAYANEGVRVVVVEGSVSVRDSAAGAARETVLGAHDMVRIAPGNLEVERGIDPRPFVAWSQGTLVFRQARLAVITQQLERVYDVRITIADSALREARVSATFADSEGVDAVLRALGEACDAAVERTGQAVTLRPKQR